MKYVLFNLTNSRFRHNIHLTEGIGASDAAVLHVSRHLAGLGHDVTVVYNGRVVESDGVLFRPFDEDLCEMVFDVAVFNRNPLYFDKMVNVDKMVLWMHDDLDAPINNNIFGVIPSFDAVIVLSPYHRDRLIETALKNDKSLPRLITAPEGLTERAIEIKKQELAIVERQPTYEFCYCSAPFKGLHVLIKKVWQEIKKSFPQAKLHICSGMGLYGAEDKDVVWQKVYDDMAEDSQIVYHGVLNNSDTLEVMRKCDFMIYPNTYAETFGNAVQESLCVGTPVLTTDLGNLDRLVRGYGVAFALDPKSDDYSDMVVKSLNLFYETRQYVLLRWNALMFVNTTWRDVAVIIDKEVRTL